MKYSQAIVVAAVASAAVVSAAPTAHQAGAHGKHTPQGKHASGTKPHLGATLKKAGSAALRTAGGAQGAAMHLGNLAMMYQSHKQNQAAAASEEPVARAVAAEAEARTPVSASATPAKASSTHPKEKATGTHDKKTNKSHHRHHSKNQEGKVHHTKESATHASATPSKVTPSTESKVPTTPVATREFFDEEDLFERDLAELEELEARGRLSGIIGKVRQAAKGHKMNTAITAASIGATVGTSVGIANSQKQQRDLTDEEFDELVARGKLGSLFSKARSAVKGHKVSGALTALNVGSQMLPQQQQRDLVDEDLELFERDLTDEEFDELVARGKLGSLFSKARSAVKGHKVSGALTALNVGSQMLPQQQQRDLSDEEFDELVARGKLGAILTKVRTGMKGHKMQTGLAAASIGASVGTSVGIANSQKQQRDFTDEEFDELVARGRLSGIIGKVRQAAKGHKMQTGLAAASIGASVGTSVGIANSQKQEKQQRDLSDEEFDELVARGKLGSLFSKARSAVKGHKVSGALTALNVGSQMMPQQQQRDLADEDLELFERGLTDDEFDELVARGKLGSLFSKARSAVKGHKVSGALTALNVGASMMPQQQQRDLTDEEIYDLVARGRLGSLISTARHALKGHKMDAAFTAANVASSIPHKQQQPQQPRDLEDFDELEMRDFDFEIDELD